MSSTQPRPFSEIFEEGDFKSPESNNVHIAQLTKKYNNHGLW